MKNLIILIQILIFLFLSGCNNDNSTNNNQTTTYGPKDPSFENGTDWEFYNGERTNSQDPPDYFMPTQGSYYMEISDNSGLWGSADQNNVDFSHSSKLIFDWEYVSNSSITGAIVSCTISFKTDTSITLWIRQFGGSTRYEKYNDTIDLPSFPNRGHLNFYVEGSEFNPILGTYKFDNFRVK